MMEETVPGACGDPPQARTRTTATENWPALIKSHLISMNNNGATKWPPVAKSEWSLLLLPAAFLLTEMTILKL